MASRKRKRLTIETKVSIIDEVEKNKATNADICRKFEIPSSTLYTTKQQYNEHKRTLVREIAVMDHQNKGI